VKAHANKKLIVTITRPQTGYSAFSNLILLAFSRIRDKTEVISQKQWSFVPLDEEPLIYDGMVQNRLKKDMVPVPLVSLCSTCQREKV
jgi:hypothetical protein